MAEQNDYSNIVGRKPFRPFSAYLPPDITFSRNGDSFSRVLPKSFDPLNEDIDLQWAGKADDADKFNMYYDYFFTGEDVKVYIDGLFDAGDELDIASFSFGITQQKSPLYGFWSYNYDVMMVGSRIVTGELAIYTRYPGKMRDLLSKAAEARTSFYSEKPTSQVQSYLRSNGESQEDEQNIQKYWANSQLDRLSYDNRNSDQRNIFSAHPPFNLIIKHGAQEGSMTTVARNQGSQPDDNYDMLDRLMSLDFNDRLSQKNSNPMDIVLQSVHLSSMSTAYAPGGNPLIEVYQFTARDMYISDGKLKNPPNGIITANDQSGSKATSPLTTSKPPTEEELLTRRDLARNNDPR
jgi:hypothetical protein